MQSATMTGSFSQGFEQSKIAKQTNVVKCCHCESPYSPQNFQFYYCCEPFKLDKLFCHACKEKKFACQNCRNQQQTIVIQPKNLGKLDEEYFKKAKNKVQVKLNKVNNSKTSTLTTNNQYDRCFVCNRNFRYEKIQSYCHLSCGQKMCFPCLFELFYQQNKMFSKDSVIKKNYRMLMSCCETEGQKIIDIQNLFKDKVCVFCGASDQATQQWFIKIQNKICFCNQCYFHQLDSKSQIVSVENVLEFIVKNSPKNCLYCQKPLKLHENMKYDIIYFNEKLCRECSGYLSQKQQSISEFLINYLPQKASIIETEIKQLQTTECSQCMQRVILFESSKKEQKSRKKWKIQFNLIKWKNKKYYCSICLYFKYEKLRKQFENKRSKIMPVTEQQLDRLSLFKTIYQNHFTRRCLICSKQQEKRQSFIILNKKTKPLEWQNLQLACRFCKKCAKFLIQQPQRYNRLKNIKSEMERRDPDFLNQFQPEKQEEKQEKNYQWNNNPLNVTGQIQSVADQISDRLFDFRQFINADKVKSNKSQLPKGQNYKQNSGSDQLRLQHTYTSKHYEQIRFSQLKFDQLLQFKSIQDEEDQKKEKKEIDKLNKGKITFEQKISREERRLLRQEQQREEKETFKREQQNLLTNRKFIESVINAPESDNQNCRKQVKKQQNSSRLPHISQQQNISMRSPTKPTMPTQSLTKAPTDINTTPPSNPCKIKACQQSTCQQLMLGLMCYDCFISYLLFGKDLSEEVESEEFNRWKEERECLKKIFQRFEKGLVG